MAQSTIKKFDVPFTQVANCVLTNPTISAAAKGVYCYLCSKPDGWQFHNDIIEREMKESLARFRAAITELIDAGLIIRGQFKDEKTNKFGGNVYELIDPSRIRKNPDTEKSECGEPYMRDIINNNNIINNTDNKEKEIKKESPQRGPSDFITSVELFDFWNRTLLPGRDNIGGIIMFDEDRERRLHKILDLIRKDQKLETYHDAFEFFKEQVTDAYDNSSFLQGRTPNNTFKFDLDFCLQRKSFIRMVEGKYEH